MEDYTFITMLLKYIAAQDEQISVQEKTINELHQELQEMLATYNTTKFKSSEGR